MPVVFRRGSQEPGKRPGSSPQPSDTVPTKKSPLHSVPPCLVCQIDLLLLTHAGVRRGASETAFGKMSGKIRELPSAHGDTHMTQPFLGLFPHLSNQPALIPGSLHKTAAVHLPASLPSWTPAPTLDTVPLRLRLLPP